MVSEKEEKVDGESKGKGKGEAEEATAAVKTYAACLWSFLVSFSGGVMLAWWEYEYHPSNSQLWMVPFGLILFVTPLLICLAILLSDLCNACSLHRDPENMIKQVIPT